MKKYATRKKGKVLLIAMLVSCFMFAATACGTDDNKNKDDNNVTSEDNNNANGKSGNNGVVDDIGNDIERGVNDIGNDLSGGAGNNGNATNGGNANSNVNSVTAGQ